MAKKSGPIATGRGDEAMWADADYGTAPESEYAGLSSFNGLDLRGIGMGGPAPTPTRQRQPQGTGPGSGEGAGDGRSAQDIYWEQQTEYARQDRLSQQNSTVSTVMAVFNEYGLGSLYSRIVDYARQGLSGDAIAIMLRETPEYQKRFPAMKALAAKGRAISEAEYISYEQTSANLERRYGLPSGMLMGNVTNLLTSEVSAAELNDRVLLASAASIQAPQDIKDTFRNYYGIDSGGMTAYFLDPKVATPLLEKQYAASLVGTEATRQSVSGVGVGLAEELVGLGVSQEQARQGFGTVARQGSFTSGAGDTVDQNALISANLRGSEGAQNDVERVALGRLGRFQGGGEYLQTNKGASGLGSASV